MVRLIGTGFIDAPMAEYRFNSKNGSIDRCIFLLQIAELFVVSIPKMVRLIVLTLLKTSTKLKSFNSKNGSIDSVVSCGKKIIRFTFQFQKWFD